MSALLIAFIVSLELISGCSTRNYCENEHPVFAQLSGCARVPNFGITYDNANDRPYDFCMLRKAILLGRYDIYETLLRYGAAPKRCEPDYEQLFYTDWMRGEGCDDERFLKSFEALGYQPKGPQALLNLAVKDGCALAVNLALDLGADPNLPDEKGGLPIAWAANALADENFRMVKALMDRGADPHMPHPDTGVSTYMTRKSLYGHLQDSKPKRCPLMEKLMLGDEAAQRAIPNTNVEWADTGKT